MKQHIKKPLCLLVAIVMAVSLLPATALAAEEYDVWVGGVRVDSANAKDVLSDGGSVVFTPATESEQARLTLNDAKITGAERPDRTNSAAGIYSEEDLTLELHGSSTVTGTDASSSSHGILINGSRLIVTGGGILNVTAGDSNYSCAISTNSMFMRSGVLRATAGKASNESEGLYSNSFTMEGGSLIAEGGEAPNSWGVGGWPAIKGGSLMAGGQTRAFYEQPDLSGYADPEVLVNTNPWLNELVWNGTDALGGDGSSFKNVSVMPAGYDVWIGGVRVSKGNQNDVLGDGTVVFTPATESEQAKLTLTNADITGTPVYPSWPDCSFGIYSEISLTLEIHGSSTVAANDATQYSVGVWADFDFTVTGDGTLYVSSGCAEEYSIAVFADSMTMRSGTIRATAGKSEDHSAGVYFYSFTMLGGALYAEAGEAPDSNGLDGFGRPRLKGGDLTAIGQTSASYWELFVYRHAESAVMVNNKPTASGAKAWNGTDALGAWSFNASNIEQGSDFKYMSVSIKPAVVYDIWIGGVYVTESNREDVLSDGGSVVFTPAAGSEPAKLTLNGANITCATDPVERYYSTGIRSDMDLTLEIHGSNTIAAGNAPKYSFGIYSGCDVKVTGNGTLDIMTGGSESGYCTGIKAGKLTVTSGSIHATGGKANNYSYGVSGGVVMEGGVLIAEGGEAPKSRGIEGADGDIAIKGGAVTAIGRTRAFDSEPDLSGWADPAVTVNTEPSELGSKAWNGTAPLGGDGSSFKYVHISEKKTYTVKWMNADGTVLETDEDVPAGAVPGYDGATPALAPTAVSTYVFEKWTPDPAPVTGDVTYTAKFHDYRAAVTEPTCTEKGYTTCTCADCGDSYKRDETPALGHDFKDGVCTRCGKADPTPPVLINPFIDVAEGTYYYDAVLWAVNATPQVTSGTSATTFSPDATCTRAQVVTFLWRTSGCPEPEMDAAASLFTDVPEDSYYYKAVLWAVQNKITNGTSATTFSPNTGCTRGQVVTFLHRFAGTPAPAGGANPFTDVAEGTYYYDAVLWAVQKGVTNGTSATTFSPGATCTRGQIVTFLYRSMQ